jgi:hypothetical protein
MCGPAQNPGSRFNCSAKDTDLPVPLPSSVELQRRGIRTGRRLSFT